MSLGAWGDCDDPIDAEDEPNYCGFCGEPIPAGVDSWDCCGRPTCVEAKALFWLDHGHTYGIVAHDDNGEVFEMRVCGVTGEMTPERMKAFAAFGRAALRQFGKQGEA